MSRRVSIITGTMAMMALAVSTVFGAQTTAGTTAQGTKPLPPPITFTDRDRKVTRTWFDAHQQSLPPGLRTDDRLSPQMESQMAPGFQLNDVLKGQIHPVPTDLLHLLAPPPGVYQYGIVGWHLVLIDDSFHVLDVIHIGHAK